MRVALGSDHGGYPLRAAIAELTTRLGHTVIDLGAATFDPGDDYPVFAQSVGLAVALATADRGILVCGSGVGASIAANKIRGVRAALCHDTFSAHQGVEDDDMNVLCLGARIIGPSLAGELVETFLSATFSNAERHQRRLAMVKQLEAPVES